MKLGMSKLSMESSRTLVNVENLRWVRWRNNFEENAAQYEL